jgi:hypothetical protein
VPHVSGKPARTPAGFSKGSDPAPTEGLAYSTGYSLNFKKLALYLNLKANRSQAISQYIVVRASSDTHQPHHL